ncbi:penicillin acylase family protein, partial [Arthrospira platensis SPKY1]|nr:penicillin acylase family protein [Arthrospira platensis SPKY1]
YAQGVNAGLQSLGARPFPYLLLRQQPEPWLPEDSLLAGFTKYFTLQDANGFGEHTRRIMQDYMPVSLQDLLLHSQFRLESPLLGQDTELSRPPQLPSASDWQQFQ